MTFLVLRLVTTAVTGAVIAAKDFNIVNDVEIHWLVLPGLSSGLGHHIYVTFVGW